MTHPPRPTDPGHDTAALRKRCDALEAELAALQSERLAERQSLLKLTAQLDALLRSSSEVRYRINADWSELGQLQGGGFIPDTTDGNRDWLESYIPPEHQDLVRAEIARAIAARDTYNLEHMVNRVDGTVGWALSRAVPLFEEDGRIESWMGAASDITAGKMSEEALRLLNSELAHRMKNTLAVVQAIVTQTLRASATVDAARQVIGARLQALASAQDVLTHTRFTEADVREIAEAALGAHQGPVAQVNLVGESYKLTPQQALGLSLSIHELATNAVKYGALSTETGRVDISWRQDDDMFAFEWLESGGPRVEPPTRRSFGSVLIERVAANYFGGEGILDFRPEGLRFSLSARRPGAV